jgi:lipopolysaccharide assembly protein A
MRAINFLIIFLICVGLVLFSVENTEPVMIKLVKGVDIQTPLCLALIGAMGFGAIVAWMFSVWTRLQRALESRQTTREIQQRDNRIQSLEKDLEQYKAEVQEQQNQAPIEAQTTATMPKTPEAIAKN